MKIFNLIVLCVMSLMIYADNIKFSAVVIDDLAHAPMKDVCVGLALQRTMGMYGRVVLNMNIKSFLAIKTGCVKLAAIVIVEKQDVI